MEDLGAERSIRTRRRGHRDELREAEQWRRTRAEREGQRGRAGMGMYKDRRKNECVRGCEKLRLAVRCGKAKNGSVRKRDGWKKKRKGQEE